MLKTLIKSIAWVVIVFIIACVIVSFNKKEEYPTCRESLQVQIPTSLYTPTETIPITYEKLDKKVAGMFKLPDRRIIINNDIRMTRGKEIEVLWHENLHVLMSQINIKKTLGSEMSSYDKEEEIVLLLTPRVIRMLQDNQLPIE